ncbi:PREDICTED: uncharacterized protein LOC104805233 isoform X1 [Tarenaya hassleriana]|uniref:uncharacterized protein LOC104805233 isoform X1 n=1 Tax=Tarenaya hassleriana TaxID=28532 RepID=UPI0008FD6873|nr:PREDICTED: uncharacterized protein LOC104805233 isoform X1 [Tarenaya hassleriana]
MAETSALCFSNFSSHITIYRNRNANSPPSAAISLRFSPFSRAPPSRPPRFAAMASHSGSFPDDDLFSFFPWSAGNNDIEWVPEERVTLFTSDGLIQIGGNMVPRRIRSSDKKQWRLKTPERFQRFQESDYMDPHQGLCLGALFDIAATNVRNSSSGMLNKKNTSIVAYHLMQYSMHLPQGLDAGRRLCILGFCRSIEMLSDVVEDTVLEHGGEIVASEKESKGGLHEKLTMTVAVPYLWGVPPASETLHLAVRTGGGIVEKVYLQWDFL